ncbi:MAG: hypothetical protein EBQ99_10585, partial [Planctomycetes bacterium]|nr:hypothetical protein [Planctomycetota bacterium]
MVTAPQRPQFTPEQLVSASLIRLGAADRNPFFASLALMAPIVISEGLDTAATDGEKLYFNPQFLANLRPAERDGLIVHEVLHAALLHVPRIGGRQPLLWNIACDIVVNGMVLADSRLALPPGGVRNEALEHLPVEEVYDIILRRKDTVARHLGLRDLRPELRDLQNSAGAPAIK